ncbi:hypothetical protein WEH80_08900 [Actinomycetes bacterium KLBMP 9759]
MTFTGQGGDRPGAVRGKANGVVMAVIALALAVAASGCVGGSRSGSDQPGVQGPPCPAAGPAGAQQRTPINESSEDDIAAVLRSCDVDEPQRWAQVVLASRPYPPGAAGQDRLRQVLVDNDAEPDEVERITNAITP